MRRLLYAALIGGITGFAILLHVAAEKACGWGFQNFPFPNVILTPVAEHKVLDLMFSAKILLYRQELVQSGLEYFVRGAGAAVLLVSLFDECFKQLKKALPGNRVPCWLNRLVALRVKDYWRVSAVLGLALLLPLNLFILCWARLDLFLFEGSLDATSLAILVPSMVLLGLITAAAHKKKLYLWQLVPSTSDDSLRSNITRFSTLGVHLAISILVIVLACTFMAITSQHCGKITFALQNNALSSPLIYKQVIGEESMIALNSALYAGIVLFLLQFVLYKCVARKSLEFCTLTATFHSFIVVWALFYMLPFIHLLVFNMPVEGIIDRLLARDVFRICVALSTIPMSLAGLAIAIAPGQFQSLEVPLTGAKTSDDLTPSSCAQN